MRQLPDDFIAALEATAAAYLTRSDPIRQSGFGGGAARWQAEREPIGAYGSRTRNLPAFDVAAFMRAAGINVAGETKAGSIPEAHFAWADAAE